MKTPNVVVRILRDKGETPLSACCVQSSVLGAFPGDMCIGCFGIKEVKIRSVCLGGVDAQEGGGSGGGRTKESGYRLILKDA